MRIYVHTDTHTHNELFSPTFYVYWSNSEGWANSFSSNPALKNTHTHYHCIPTACGVCINGLWSCIHTRQYNLSSQKPPWYPHNLPPHRQGQEDTVNSLRYGISTGCMADRSRRWKLVIATGDNGSVCQHKGMQENRVQTGNSLHMESHFDLTFLPHSPVAGNVCHTSVSGDGGSSTRKMSSDNISADFRLPFLTLMYTYGIIIWLQWVSGGKQRMLTRRDTLCGRSAELLYIYYML